MFTIFPWLNKVLSFKELPWNSTLILVPTYFNKGLRILLDVEGGLILSLENPLDFHVKIWLLVLLILLKYLYGVWNTK